MDEMVVYLVEAVTELGLERKSESRETKRYLENTILVPSDCPMSTEGLSEGKSYKQDVQTEEDGPWTCTRQDRDCLPQGLGVDGSCS